MQEGATRGGLDQVNRAKGRFEEFQKERVTAMNDAA